jgi:hypothetical protein
VDLNGLGQEEASAVMGVLRRTTWKDLHEARRKVIDALIHGRQIEIAGCERRIAGRCPEEAKSWPEAESQHCQRRHRLNKECFRRVASHNFIYFYAYE